MPETPLPDADQPRADQPGAELPGVVARSSAAAPPRTLLDVLAATTAAHPEASALEDDRGALSYRELIARVEAAASALAGAGAPRRPGRRADALGRPAPVHRDPRRARRRRRLRARRRRRPRGARRPRLRRGRRRRRHRGRRRLPDPRPGRAAGHAPVLRPGARTPARHGAGAAVAAAPTGGRRLDHLHLGLHRHPEGRGREPPVGRRLRRRRGPAVPAGDRAARPLRATACSPGCRSPSTPRARRCGWPGGTAPAWCPRPRSLVRSGVDLGPWLVDPRHHRRLDRADPRRALAGRVARERAAADLRRRGVPARARRPGLRRRPRGLEHLRADRGDRRRARRPGACPASRCASGCRSTAGTSRSSTPDGRAGRRRRGRRADHRRRRPRPLPRPGEGRREVRAARRARLGARLPQRRPGALRPRPGCSSRAAPTTRSRSAAGASSSARSRRRCRTCPASPARPPPCARPTAGNQVLVGYLAVAASRAAFDRAAALARLREELPAALVPAAGAWSTATCRRAPRARSTAPRCRGRCPTQRRRRGRRADAPTRLEPRRRLAGGARPARRRRRRRTSSTSAAARSPPPSSSRGSASATPSSPSPTSTPTRGSARWPTSLAARTAGGASAHAPPPAPSYHRSRPTPPAHAVAADPARRPPASSSPGCAG